MDNQILAFASRSIRTFTVQSARRNVARVITEMQQRVERRISDENHIAATTTIATRWTTTRDKLLTPESCNAVTSVAPLHVNLGPIDKHLKNQKRRRAGDAAQASRTFYINWF